MDLEGSDIRLIELDPESRLVDPNPGSILESIDEIQCLTQAQDLAPRIMPSETRIPNKPNADATIDYLYKVIIKACKECHSKSMRRQMWTNIPVTQDFSILTSDLLKPTDTQR